MKILSELIQELNRFETKISHYADQNIEEAGTSERMNNDNIIKTKMEIELCKTGGMAELDVLVWTTDEYGNAGAIASKKKMCKNSDPFFIIEVDNETHFLNSCKKESYYKKYGLKKEKRIVPAHLIHHTDNCFRSTYFLAQNDQVIYSM